MRNRTRWVLGLVLVAAAASILLWWVATGPREGITPRNIAAIKKGMPRADVEKLMGTPPPGVPLADVTVEALPDDFVAKHAKAGTGAHWIGREGAVFVVFDGQGNVSEVRPLKVGRMAAAR